MTIWKQGPFHSELRKKNIILSNLVYPGPSDPLIQIDGFNVIPDADGNFIEGTNGSLYSKDALDAIHTYAIVRYTINLYERLFEKSIEWSWWQIGSKHPLKIQIRNCDINARFIKEQKCIELDYYGPSDRLVYNCRSVDLVAHETAHAIFDTFRPEWSKGSPETRGLEEAFCDLAPMFFILSQLDLCTDVISETNGDLKKDSLLSLFGVGHGFEDQTRKAIRNANNSVTYKKGDWNWYTYGELVIGLLYDVLVDMFEAEKKQHKNDAEALSQTGKVWMKKIMSCYNRCDIQGSSISDFCKTMTLEFEGQNLKKHFKERKIL